MGRGGDGTREREREKGFRAKYFNFINHILNFLVEFVAKFVVAVNHNMNYK